MIAVLKCDCFLVSQESVFHGGNSDDLVSIPAMTGTVAVNILCLYRKKEKEKKQESDVIGCYNNTFSLLSNNKC